MQRLTVIGGGAWGTALAATARRAGRDVVLWARDAEIVEAVNRDHENPAYLPCVGLDPAIHATADLAEAAVDAEAALLVVPAQHLRAVAERLHRHLPPGVPVLLCAKGVEQHSLALMTEVAAAALPEAPQAVLSGPTFAAEVARGLPTAVTVAAADPDLAARFAAALGTPSFRPYASDDPVGAEIGGAVKNVLAIACGIVAGRRLGDNARAALITRGLAEIVRLAVAKGGRAETLMGLSGLGDLTLTCTGMQSRNHSLGVGLGEGRALADVLAGRRSVAEGVPSASSVTALAARLGVEMPIAAAVDAILHRGAAIDDTVAQLLARPFRRETIPAAGR
jgi:glycerol-3-phosphate dehydrogenase (NAD(P)+)